MTSLLEITYEYIDSLKYVKEIKRDITIGEYTDMFALIGPRRVGKTFTLLKKAKELIESGKQVIYASLDEPFLREIKVRKFAELVRKEYPDGAVYLFLDEIQEWRNWDYNLRWLHDIKDFRIYVSGSSSTLMSMEIPKRLRGRYISKTLYPLSFREITRFEIRTFREKGRVLRLMEDYLKWGGFPEIWLTRSREKIVSLVQTIFYRDIVERFRIEDYELFKTVFYHVLSNYSNMVTYRSLTRLLKGLGIDINVKTLINYISYMRQAFLIFINELFTYSYRRRIVNPKKIYIIDQSITNLFPEKLDIGRKIENIVYIELLRRKDESMDIWYYKTRGNDEIDFVITKHGVVQHAIEATYDIDEAHIRKMVRALEELGLKEGVIITWRSEDIIDRNSKRIRVVPLWKWLLGIKSKHL